MSVTAPAGFEAAGVASGIKEGGLLDMALVSTQDRCGVAAAAVFTTNRAAGAPVEVSRRHLALSGGRVAAVLLNSGNANAATGPQGLAVAERSTELVAQQIGVSSREVLCCSTGLIGIPLGVSPFEHGIPALVGALSSSKDSASQAARAILTTDSRPKEVVVKADGWSIGAMAKGAAMLAPNMATMLAVITTDAVIGPGELDRALRSAVARSFHELSVDGCCSTNDTVIVMASGKGAEPNFSSFVEALQVACDDLAAQMADDAEGATKVATIFVKGAQSSEDAARIARRVGESQLVKCSLHGSDPYWGRVLAEVGAAGVEVDPAKVDISYGGVVVCRGGGPAVYDREALADHMAGRHVMIEVVVGAGPGTARMRTTALSPQYVELNAKTS